MLISLRFQITQCLTQTSIKQTFLPLCTHLTNGVSSFVFFSNFTNPSLYYFHYKQPELRLELPHKNFERYIFYVMAMENHCSVNEHPKSVSDEEHLVDEQNQALALNKPKQGNDGKLKIHLPPSLQYRGRSIPEEIYIRLKSSTVLPSQEIEKNTNIETNKRKIMLPPSLRYQLPPENESTQTASQAMLHVPEKNIVEGAKGQLPASLLKYVESFVKENLQLVTDQINKSSSKVQDCHKDEFSQENHIDEPATFTEDHSSSDPETPFRKMALLYCSDSTNNDAAAHSKELKKSKKKASKRKIFIALTVAVIAIIVSSFSSCQWWWEKNMAKSLKRDSKRQNLPSDSDITPDEKPKKKRPNYFVAVQVNDKQIADKAVRIQKGIQDVSGHNLTPLLIASETFHITLMVMHLASQEEVDRACQCLEKSGPAVKEILTNQQDTLEFESLSSFGGGRVVFACVKSPGLEVLQLLSDEVRKNMKECDIESADPENKPFHPHLTLMKFRWKSKSKDPKKVEASWYEAFNQDFLGSQTIESLQLCRMHGKRDDGYYIVDHEVSVK